MDNGEDYFGNLPVCVPKTELLVINSAPHTKIQLPGDFVSSPIQKSTAIFEL